MIAQDKLIHFLGGLALYAMALPFGLPVACAVLLLAAIGKEVYDYCHRDAHTPEIMDAVATLAGGAVYAAWLQIIT